MPNIHISVQGVKKQLEKIVVTKACGPDLIPARVLKESASEIAPILAEIFQQSLDSGKLPSAWKDANVSCIYKKGQRSNPENYRPISLTSLVCKVLEHIICSQVCVFSLQVQPYQCFDMGSEEVFPVRLISLVYEWSKVLNERGQVDVVFLDFAKAFDSVPHQRLLKKAD